MGVKTLISFLGKSGTGYAKAHYKFSDNKIVTTEFFGLALLDQISPRPDKLILVGTRGSMWDWFFWDLPVTNDSKWLELLLGSVKDEAVTPEMLLEPEKLLTEKHGLQVQCLLIPYAKNEEEQVDILLRLAGVTSPGEQVILDVTHGFRHLPMLALVAARYLTKVRQVNVVEVYYGAREMTDKANDQTPVLQLGAMLGMLDWIEALSAYDASGNYAVFRRLLEQDGMHAGASKLLDSAAFYERLTNASKAREKLTGALEKVQTYAGPLGMLFKDNLQERIGWFRKGARHDWELSLAERYFERGDYLRAILYLYEGFVTLTVFKDRGNSNDFEERESARNKYTNKHPELRKQIELLKNLRNAVAHGVMSENKAVQDVLNDPEKLSETWRALRKNLFS